MLLWTLLEYCTLLLELLQQYENIRGPHVWVWKLSGECHVHFYSVGDGIMLPGGWPVGYGDDHFSATEDKHSIPGSMGTLSFSLQGNISKYVHQNQPYVGKKFFVWFTVLL